MILIEHADDKSTTTPVYNTSHMANIFMTILENACMYTQRFQYIHASLCPTGNAYNSEHREHIGVMQQVHFLPTLSLDSFSLSLSYILFLAVYSFTVVRLYTIYVCVIWKYNVDKIITLVHFYCASIYKDKTREPRRLCNRDKIKKFCMCIYMYTRYCKDLYRTIRWMGIYHIRGLGFNDHCTSWGREFLSFAWFHVETVLLSHRLISFCIYYIGISNFYC